MDTFRVSTIFLVLFLVHIQDSAGYSKDDISAVLSNCGREVNCPRKYGWVLHKTHCYRVYKQSETNAGAARICKNAGGSLARILNEATMKKVQCMVLKRLKDNTSQRVWIGARKKGNFFKWDHGGRTMRYTNWVAGQPDFTAGKENCVEMNWKELGKWNDDRCWKKKSFVCVFHRRSNV